MATNAKHTPGPWQINSIDGGHISKINDNNGEWIATVDVSNAAHIVRCVNAHADLVAALEISTRTLQTVLQNDSKNIAAKCCIERNNAIITSARGKA